MHYLFYPAALIFGFIALIVGANIFVDGSSYVAKRLRIPSLVIGLTVVALGTSAPELAVSVTSAAKGSNELALSNVVGSNIFNMLAVLGVLSLMKPVPVTQLVTKRDLPLLIGVSALLFFAVGGSAMFTAPMNDMNKIYGSVGRVIGVCLLIGFIVYLIFLIRGATKNQTEDELKLKKGLSMPKSIVFILAGIALIVGGGEAVVYGARKLASSFGISETLIGLTIVAVGTSLPELVTSIVAAMKGETELAVGNAVGSNILNIMLILGLSALIRPIGVNLASMYDTLIMLFTAVLTLVFAITRKKIMRFEGAAMIIVYIASIVFAVMR